ncbi:hypothetical protein ABB37_05330 [Leptomonas pyrrhocoris]|uniref:Transmembrane protein n=1 Tax=Leptomonas pyrrhocoris TaxID=157538 RepID=A0A0M9FZW4_LEPPY|nr:hypothetical protein ABB37_05330 [Leptomonas pyrrhocoris]XP_015657944.1 hypothetical protein ABB37_05330 [Leptomonas pyrrhocoris]KPA79504.1 hypothetical protein ABB37_05330 [Leptomonas pyrrhocoris]KPA79505.1 hypothetical protein ABB37_05330 [Leptomonas pyrrhocoris]|eukprot:XP_015657943.1 hypothetical protein ABB37_05330 [Leptomonas pyrrhocoris]
MSWPKDPFVTDGAYKTPLPSQPCERQVWRVVARLYAYNTLAALMKVNEGVTAASAAPPPSPSGRFSAVPAALPASRDITSPTGSAGSTTARAKVVERRSAFLVAADSSSGVSHRTCSPSSTQPVRRAHTDPLVNAAPTTAAAGVSGGGSTTPPLVTEVPATASLSLPSSTYSVRGSSRGWNNTSGSGGSMGRATGCMRAASLRALEPLQSLLREFAEKQWTMSAGVVDVAVQHPLPCLRVELVRLLLTYPFWDWSMCAPVAVAAGIGDIDVLHLLVEVKELDANTGFPLTVAVRRGQEEAVVPFLLSHHRIRPNYGGGFFTAVVLGNVRAMYLLGDAAGVNVNRFANNEGTSALLYALRQYLACRRRALQQQQVQLDTPPPPPLQPSSHATKPHQAVTSPTEISSDALNKEEEEEISTTPLLVVHSGGDSGGAECATGRSVSSSPPSMPQGAQRDNPLFGSRSPEVEIEAPEGEEMGLERERQEQRRGRSRCVLPRAAAAAAAASGVAGGATVATPHGRDLTADDTLTGSLRKDSQGCPLQTARHWREVLLYLLDHPAVEVNAGFYMTPLQVCVLAGDAEVVSWLLQHPHLRPSRLSKAMTAFRNSYYLLRHHGLSLPAMQCVVAAPIEMSSQLGHLDIFRLLARDQRIHVPVGLTMDLERSAADGEVIPFLTVLAQYREEWEGWGWRWRRRCLLIATASTTVFALCFWIMLLLWRRTLQGCLLVLTGTYVLSAVVSVLLYVWEVYGQRCAAAASLTHGATALLALVRHLCPASSSLRQHTAVATLLACPGALPLLDVLCAWCLYSVHRSRRRLQPASGSSANDAAAAAATASSHSVTPTAVGLTHGGPSHPHPHHPHHYHEHDHHARPPARTQRAAEPLSEMERLSSTGSWGWSVGVPHASEFSSSGSFSDASPGASMYGPTAGAGNESFSRPRPAVARTRRQTAFVGDGEGNSRSTVNNNCNAATGAGARAQATDWRSTSMTSPPSGGGRHRLSFAAASSTGGAASSGMASPSLCTSRSRGSWVVPGRPSRYVLTTEYHAPDLLLRALAYSAFDRVATLPRLLTCVVGIFMFMYMVFPSAAPPSSASSSSSHTASTVHAVAGAIRSHSSFTLYYGATPPPITLQQPSAYNLSAAASEVVMAASSPDLPAYTFGVGLIGLCGLVSSVIGGGALLGMMGSLRTVTVQAFFVNPSDKADIKGGNSRVEGRAGGHTDWQAMRHRAREAQPEYAL